MRQMFINKSIPKYLIAVMVILLTTTFIGFAQKKPQVDRLKRAETLYAEAGKLYEQGTVASVKAAFTKFDEARKLFKLIGDRKNESACLYWEASILVAFGADKNAVDFFSLAIFGLIEAGDKNGAAMMLSNIGGVYKDAGNKPKAIEYFFESAMSFKELGDKTHFARTLILVGFLNAELGNYQKALEYDNQVLPIFKELDDKGGEATVLHNIGGVYDKLGEYQKALEYYNQALPLRKLVGDKSEEANTLNSIGKTYTDLNKNQKAIEYFNQALVLRKSVGDKVGEGNTLSNLGFAYSALGEKQKALEYFNQALVLHKATTNKAMEATTLNNIGLVFDVLNDKKKALEYFNQALPLFKTAGDKNGEAVTYNNIGSIYLSLDESKKALDYFNLALPLFKIVGNKISEADTLNNLGNLYAAFGANQLALDSFNQALTLQKSIGNKSADATTLNNIGIIYIRINEKQKAIEQFNQAIQTSRLTGDKRIEAITLSNLMYLWGEDNRKFSAFYGKQSVNLFQQLRANIKGLDKSIQQSYLKSVEHTYRDLAAILIADSRLSEAQAVLDLLKSEEFAGMVLRSGEKGENVPYSRAEDLAIKVVDQLAALGREKGELNDKQDKSSLTDAEKQRFRDLQKQIEIAEAEFNKSLTALSAETNNSQNVETVAKDAQAFMEDLRELGNGTVALYTVIINDSKPAVEGNVAKDSAKESIKTGWIILVTPEFRKAYPIDVASLEQTIFQFRTALSSPTYDPQPLAQELYKKLFLQTSDKQKTTLATDLDKYFKDKADKTLMWSLDGVLRYVPMAALHDGKTYLVEKYRNTIFNSASKGRLNVAVKPKWTVLGLGVSVERTESGKKFSALGGAKRELQTIVKQTDSPTGLMNGIIKMDEQFTSDAMFDSLAFDKNPVVHIASHFSYQVADFNESFLLLGKGKLSVKDLSAKSTLFSNVDLLTLSACETAVGGANGKDVEGFAYLAQSLGAKAVMATLWQVDDIGTQVLMPEFYRLHETGLNKSESLRQAQIALLQGKIKEVPSELKRAELFGTDKAKTELPKYVIDKNKPFAHPYYWSPFVLIGNWK